MAAIERGMRMSLNLSRFLGVLKRKHGLSFSRQIGCCRTLNAEENNNDGKPLKDPLPIFFKDEVQTILKKISGLDIEKVYAPRKAQVTARPHYKLLTDEELKEEKEMAVSRAQDRLQIPPVMSPRVSKTTVLSHDPEIAHLSEKIIFADIQLHMKDQERLVVVREGDGTLRTANWDERDRINLMVNPKPNMNMTAPRMFQTNEIERMLGEEKTVYLLERACIQFEPDDPEFIRITHHVYDHILTHTNFDVLRSTRFFGPMCFYYCREKTIDLLLADMVRRDLLSDGVDLIKLRAIILDEPFVSEEDECDMSIIKRFCETEAVMPDKLQLERVIQAHEEVHGEQQRQHAS